MTLYLVTTKEGGLYRLSLSSASASALGNALDPKDGLLAKQFLPVKAMVGDTPVYVNVDSIANITKATGDTN